MRKFDWFLIILTCIFNMSHSEYASANRTSTENVDKNTTSKHVEDMKKTGDKNQEKLDEMLIFASQTGNLEKVKEALKEGANIHGKKFGMAAFGFSVIYYHSELADFLLKKGANIDERDNGGYTPLLSVIGEGVGKTPGYQVNPEKEKKIYEMVNFLIERGADINGSDNVGFSPILNATKWGYYSIVDLIASNKHFDSEKSKHSTGMSALMVASYEGYNNIVELLLSRKIYRPNETSNDGVLTALTSAVDGGNPETVKILIEDSAVITPQNAKLITDIIQRNSDGPLKSKYEKIAGLIDNRLNVVDQ